MLSFPLVKKLLGNIRLWLQYQLSYISNNNNIFIHLHGREYCELVHQDQISLFDYCPESIIFTLRFT